LYLFNDILLIGKKKPRSKKGKQVVVFFVELNSIELKILPQLINLIKKSEQGEEILYSIYFGSEEEKLLFTKEYGVYINGDRRSVSRAPLERPEWVPDEFGFRCVSCRMEFGVFLRRHHCRSCGDIFCDRCCHNWEKLPTLKYNSSVRVCNTCRPLYV